MPRKKSPSPTHSITLKPNISHCPRCGKKLKVKKYLYRVVQTIKGPVREITAILHCQNVNCDMYGVEIRPARLAPDNHSFGYDVISLIVILRSIEKKSCREISRAFKRIGVSISRETVRRRFVEYQLLASMEVKRRNIEAVRERGYAIISLDGAQPEKGKASLWIVREATLDIPVYARILQNQGIDDIASMLMDVKRILGVPVIAVISDGQRSIARAVRRVFPHIRHQFCQFHYLRNISMRACDADRNLAKKMRSRIRSLFHYRKSRNPRRKPSERLRRMGEIIYSIISTRARYPRVFAGIEIYEALERLLEEAHDIDDRDCRKLLERIGKILEDEEMRYEGVVEAREMLVGIGRILKNDDGLDGSEVKGRLIEYIESLRPKTELGVIVLDDIRSQTRMWLENLFHTYDDPRIPGTNNGMEALIRRMKRDIRRMTGWRVSNDYCIRWGAFHVFLMDMDEYGIIELVRRVRWDVASSMCREYREYLRETGLSSHFRCLLRKMDYVEYLNEK